MTKISRIIDHTSRAEAEVNVHDGQVSFIIELTIVVFIIRCSVVNIAQYYVGVLCKVAFVEKLCELAVAVLKDVLDGSRWRCDRFGAHCCRLLLAATTTATTTTAGHPQTWTQGRLRHRVQGWCRCVWDCVMMVAVVDIELFVLLF